MDVTGYLDTYGLTPRELATDHDSGRAAHDRHHGHGRASARNLYLCQGRHGHRGQARSRRTKTACASPQLDELSYRRTALGRTGR